MTIKLSLNVSDREISRSNLKTERMFIEIECKEDSFSKKANKPFNLPGVDGPGDEL